MNGAPRKFLLLTSQRPDLVKVWVCQESSPAGSLLPPVDLASIAASLREAGAEVRLLDLRLARDPYAALAATCEEFNPDAVTLNLTTTSALSDFELLARVPASVKRIVFGTHAQSSPAECFGRGIHAVMVGDPEAVATNLLKHQGGWETAPGLLVPGREKADPLTAPALDELPFPALDLLDLDAYHAPYIRPGRRFTILMSSRGCPFKCTYCLYPVLFGGKGRPRSARNIVDEMEHDYLEHRIRDFYFLDATFNLDVKHVSEICRELIARGLKEIAWSCNMRVAPVPDEMLKLMKEAGCRWIFYGVEDQDLLRETKKATTKNATLDAFQRTKAAGILTMAFTMVFPRDDMKSEAEYSRSVLATLDALGADAFQCNMAIPFPGTEIHGEYEKNFGTLSRDWSLYDPHGKSLPYSPPQDLKQVKRRVYRGFFWKHPIQVARVALAMDPRALLPLFLVFVKRNFLARFLEKDETTPGRRSA